MNVSLRLAAALVLAAVIFGSPALADEKPDQDAIVHLMKATFDKPDSPLAVDPVSVEADYAVAGWTQNGMGGRALLRKKEGEWRLVLCSGAPLKSAEAWPGSATASHPTAGSFAPRETSCARRSRSCGRLRPRSSRSAPASTARRRNLSGQLPAAGAS